MEALGTMTTRLLLLYLLLPWTCGNAAASTTAPATEQADLLPENYYTLHQDQNHVTLRINHDGTLEWDKGFPSLYSIIREEVVRSVETAEGEETDEERMHTLEAAATRHWICMRRKGGLYTVDQQEYYKEEKRKLQRIRHEAQKRSRKRWAHPPSAPPAISSASIAPPANCLFKTFHFNPNESYERSVAVYSFPHSNSTHGRFLAINVPSVGVRTYRKPFSQLNHSSNLKISQVPIRYLSLMVNATKFSRGVEYNGRVRRCIMTLLQCPNQQHKVMRDKGGKSKKGTHFYRIIERCKRRAMRRDEPPAKCGNRRGGGGLKKRLLRRSQRRRRRKKAMG